MPVDLQKLKSKFAELYQCEPRFFRAPGRVNLIGEHTDYNQGFVLPVAIERETVVAAAPRADKIVRVFSLEAHETIEFDLENLSGGHSGAWRDYVEGTAHGLTETGAMLAGANLAVISDVPSGAGLSSSAALEISVGLALIANAGAQVELVSVALAGQWAEHNYVGTRSGIMDQFVVALAKRDCALLIDCRSLQNQPVALNLDNYRIAICDTRVKHELASSEYNTRRAECEHGAELLKKYLPKIESLRDVSAMDFMKYGDKLPPKIKKRCRHVVSENARTLSFVRSLEDGDIAELGELMRLSHESLRDDYEVSAPELDRMVEIAARLEPVAGARMTGGGFGGCTVNLVRSDGILLFEETIRREYFAETGIEPAIYFSNAAAGACEI